MTRAVIKLSKDISNALPTIASAIKTCAYNANVPVIGFRYKELRVIVHSKEIIVKDIENKAQAIEVIDFLKDTIKNADESTAKTKI